MRARKAAGFTLVELSISLVLMAPLLLIVAQLLFEAQWTLTQVARQSRGVRPEFAVALLQRDLRSARTRPNRQLFWSSGPLTLRLNDGTTVVYAVSQEQFTRQPAPAVRSPNVRTPDARTESQGPPPAHRTRLLLDDVVQWRWRELYPGLVEVEWVYETASSPNLRNRRGTAWKRDRAMRRQSVRLQIARRAGAGGYRW